MGYWARPTPATYGQRRSGPDKYGHEIRGRGPLPVPPDGGIAARGRRVRAIFEALDIETARTLLAPVVTDFEQQAPTAIATLERGFDDATAVLALPRPYRKRLRTTNGQERLNEEVRRRERVIRICPNRQSAIRLLGALRMEQDEAWSTGKRYLGMTAYWQWREASQDRPQGSVGLS